MTLVTALCPFQIAQGPCSATTDAINTPISLTLSAVRGEATEETLGVDYRLVIPHSYTWCSCDKTHTPPRTLGEDPA